MKRRRLLLVSYYFPPVAGSGVFRPLRLARYLPGEGWDVSALAVTSKVRLPKDPRLEDEIPPEVQVIRTRTAEPRGLLLGLHKLGLKSLADRLEPWFFLPDDQRGWVPFASAAGRKLLEEVRHDAVLSTSSPYSAHLVGESLARRFRVPWVADFRDEWTTNPYLRYPTAWHRRRNEVMEQRVLRSADAVTCVSDVWLDTLRELAGPKPAGRFVFLPNTFDGAHFSEPPPPLPEDLHFVYTGSFYGVRSPQVLLEGLSRFAEEDAGALPRWQVTFVGATGLQRETLPARLAERVRLVPHLPYHEALAYLSKAAVLLLVIPPEGGRGNLTGKLYNYLAAGRPILALAPECNRAAELIRKTRSGWVAPPDDPAAVASAVRQIARWWRRTPREFHQDRAAVRSLDIRRQAPAWRELLESLLNRRNR